MKRFALLLLLSSPLSAAYVSQDCGFDLDDNGVKGEAADCNICDATVSGGNIVAGTTDPDGDGDSEDLYYVDCGGVGGDADGVDQASCGLPSNPPCLSLDYAMTNADGSGDGDEDIICFKGTCTGQPTTGLEWLSSGVAGTRDLVVPETGVTVKYPTDPHMLVGWDTDADNSFPPFDTDDVSIIDGGGTLDVVIDNTSGNDANGMDYLEFAHFKVDNYSQDDPADIGAYYRPGHSSGAQRADYVYHHDIEIIDYARGMDLNGDQGLIRMNRFTHLILENMLCSNCGGFIFRGGVSSSSGCAIECAGPSSGPLLVRDWTVTANACTGGACVGDGEVRIADIWEFVNDVMFIDSLFDYQPDVWDTSSTLDNNVGINMAQCSQDFYVINNEFIDWDSAVRIEAGDGSFCDDPSRITDRLTVDRNLIRYTQDKATADRWVFHLTDPGPAEPNAWEGNATFTNNMVIVESAANDDIEMVFNIEAGRDAPNGAMTGTLNIVNNTIRVAPEGTGDKRAVSFNGAGATYNVNNVVLKNNIWELPANWWHYFFVNGDTPSALDSDYNIFDVDGDWRESGSDYTTLAAWDDVIPSDANSDTCAATFVSATDSHLQVSDICAIDNCETLLGITMVDFDNDARPASNWDCGAHEFESVLGLTNLCCGGA